MRLWMRGQMRRRGKRGVNDSESTGKIGQEIPANQPTPLQPMYPEDQRRKASEPKAAEMTSVKPEQDEDLVNEPPERTAVEVPPPEETLAAGKLVVETQPESPS